MPEITGSYTWGEELASLLEDTGIRYTGDAIGVSTPSFDAKRSELIAGEGLMPEESLQDQVKGFVKAWGEIIVELGRGCRDVAQQSILTEDSYVMQNLIKPCEQVSGKLRFLNDFLPEDRDPVHVWPVIIFISLLTLTVLGVLTKQESSLPVMKKVRIHPASANRIQLPDGRFMAYNELGVPADRAIFSLIAPHSFLSSRLAGIPGIRVSLLEEFGVRLVTYDLPGFGESDPHPNRSLNSSALDILHLADAVSINGKFWVLGYSSGAIHAWAALKYIPSRIAGAAMFSPMVNPYESSMTKEDKSRTWEKWTPIRKVNYYLARRFPKLLSYSFSRTFLSGRHGSIEKWLSLTLGKRDRDLIEKPKFEEFWHRNVEESIRQGIIKPFTEEAVLQVSNWGFSPKDIRVQKKCPKNGFFPFLSFLYSQDECELTGFLGPIHIWQGMDDMVVPSSMSDYLSRVLPNALMHRLPNEGHFSYFWFCDDCHRRIFSTLFGKPQGPLEQSSFVGDRDNESSLEFPV